MKKPHTADQFERDIRAFLDRRLGQAIDDHFIEQFMTYLWPKKVKLELKAMRSMVAK